MSYIFTIAIAGGSLIVQILIVAAICAAVWIVGQLILQIDPRFVWGIIALIFLAWIIALLTGLFN